MEDERNSFLKAEWKSFKKPQILVKSGFGSLLMTSVTAYENISGGHPWEDYDQALYVRAPWAFCMGYVFLRVHETIRDVAFSELRFKRPLSVLSTSTLGAVSTYVTQKMAQDPEALSSSGWAAVISITFFTVSEVSEVLSNRK